MIKRQKGGPWGEEEQQNGDDEDASTSLLHSYAFYILLLPFLYTQYIANLMTNRLIHTHRQSPFLPPSLALACWPASCITKQRPQHHTIIIITPPPPQKSALLQQPTPTPTHTHTHTDTKVNKRWRTFRRW